jgi:hypothetical protein
MMNQTQKEELFTQDDIISVYTSDEAVADGNLFKLSELKQFKDFPVNFITTELMSKGYFTETDGKKEPNIPNLMDLTFAIAVFCRKKAYDRLYILDVELPSGDKQKIYVQQNETGKYTAMLPGEY